MGTPEQMKNFLSFCLLTLREPFQGTEAVPTETAPRLLLS